MTLVNHPLRQDIDDVFRFMNQCDIAEFGEPDTSREDLDLQWDEIDIERDAWLAHDPQGHVIGYCDVARDNEFFNIDIYIHPHFSPQGVEDLLMRNCERRIREVASTHGLESNSAMIGYATRTNQRQQQVYEKNGFERVNYHFRMQIDLPEPVEPPQWPVQYRLETYRDVDESDLYQLVESAFTWPGHVMPPLESWRNHIFRGGRYDPQYFVLVRDEEMLVGAALSYDEEVQGWIRQLAVHKEYQGKGLGSLLLRHMFSIYRQKNIKRIALGVSSKNENACQFYERHGMYRSREFIEYRRNLV